MTFSGSRVELDVLLRRGDDPKRPSLENRVAFQWEQPVDTLGLRQSTRRDATILRWLTDAVQGSPRPAAVLDLGCAYGNHLLMLNAMLRRDSGVELHGIDLYEGSIEYARSFAANVAGYANCHFDVADITAPLAFDDRTFNAVNIADVLEHLEKPEAVLSEIRRILQPGGTLVISTPLRTSVFKTAAAALNRLTAGRLYRGYYSGKETELDQAGRPVMETHAGHDHISEMSLTELRGVLEQSGFAVEETELMPIMSGSAWFDEHPLLLAGLLVLEGFHDRLRRPSWAHAVCVRAVA